MANAASLSANAAFITPTLESELITDGGCEIWTDAYNLTNWSKNLAGSSTLNQDSLNRHSGAYCARLDIDSSGSMAQIAPHPDTAPAYTWCRYSIYAKTSLAGQRFQFVPANAIASPAIPLTTDYLKYTYICRKPTVGMKMNIGRKSAKNCSIYLDDASIRAETFTSCLAGSRTTVTRDFTISQNMIVTPGTQIGFCANLDSQSRPANYVLAYINGSYALIDKVVAGLPTNLLTVQQTWIDNDEFRLVKSGTSYSIYHNGTQMGTTVTISDAGIINNSLHMQFSTYELNQFTSPFAVGLSGNEVTFPQNDGNSSFYCSWDNAFRDWSSLDIVNSDRFVLVNDHHRSGLRSAHVTVNPGDVITGGERAEADTMIDANGNKIYETIASGTQYLTISVFLPTGWTPPADTNRGIVLQLHSPNTYNSSPAFALVASDRYFCRMKVGDMSGVQTPTIYGNFTNSSLALGNWVDFVVMIRFAIDGTGEVAVWRRDAGQAAFSQMMDVNNIDTLQYQGTAGNHYWKCGYYRGYERVINSLYIDCIGRASTFNSAVKRAWY